MRTAVSYTHYAAFPKERTGNIFTFAQFEEGDLLSDTGDDAESGDESDDNSTMPPIISEEEIDVMDSGDETDDEPMSMEHL